MKSGKKDTSLERQLFRRNSEDCLIGSEKWHSPLPLERIFLVEPGCKSVERQVQMERVRYVLQAIYFTRESIPASPEEPDLEAVEHSVPLDIPLEDLTVTNAKDSSNAQISEKLLVVKDAQGNAQMSLNPEVADLVKSLAENLSCVPSAPEAPNASVDRKHEEKAEHINNTCPPAPPTTQPHPSLNSGSSNQTLQRELWEVLEDNYPDINVRELSAERIRDLLEPLKEQLVARGIFQLPRPDSLPPALAPFQHSPPRIPPAYGLQPHYRNIPPPSHIPPHIPQPDFRPGPPPGFCPPGMGRPPRFHQLPIIPGFARGPGPCRGGPPPHRPGPYMRGSGRGVRGSQPCKFFQQGTCRNGLSCTFAHTTR